MQKRLLNNLEMAGMIRDMYESDAEHILSVHETPEDGLEGCINRTVADYILNDVKIFGLEDHGKLIAYFGEQNTGKDLWLTGFMIAPEYRPTHKSDVWKSIVSHFNGSLITGVYSKNGAASRFLKKQGCKLIESRDHTHGPCEIFEYRESK